MQKRGLSLAFIQKICVLYLVVWMISPPMEIDLIYRVVALGCSALWFVIMIIREGSLTLSANDIAAIVFMFAVYRVRKFIRRYQAYCILYTRNVLYNEPTVFRQQ